MIARPDSTPTRPHGYLPSLTALVSMAVAAWFPIPSASAQAQETAELRGPVRWVVLGDDPQAKIGNEFAALRLRGNEVVIDTRASRPAAQQSIGEAAALVFPVEENESLAELVGHSWRGAARERGGPTARQALLISTAARLSLPTTRAALVVCSMRAVAVHGSGGEVLEYRSARPEIQSVVTVDGEVMALIKDGDGLLALTIRAAERGSMGPFPFRIRMARAALAEGEGSHVAGAVWTDPARQRAIALVHGGRDSSTVGLYLGKFDAVTAPLKEIQRLPIALGKTSGRLPVAYLRSRHGGRKYLAVGDPADDHGSGVLRIFVQENGRQTWTPGTSFHPERYMWPESGNSDQGYFGTGGGEAVVLHELGPERTVVAFVTAPFGGAFASIHCLDVETGLPLWTLPGADFCVAGGTVGRTLDIVDLPDGWTLLKATRTRSDPSGNTPGGYDRQGVPALLLDARSGEVIGVN